MSNNAKAFAKGVAMAVVAALIVNVVTDKWRAYKAKKTLLAAPQ